MEPSREGEASACRVVARPLPTARHGSPRLSLRAVDEGVEASGLVGSKIEEPKSRAFGIDADDERDDVDWRAAVWRRKLDLHRLAGPETLFHTHLHTGRRELGARAVERALRSGDAHAQLHGGARDGAPLDLALAGLLPRHRDGLQVGEDLAQTLERDGLPDEVQGAELQAGARFHFRRDARDDDHRDRGAAGGGEGEELDAAHAGEPDVEQDRVGPGGGECLERAFRAADDPGLVAQLADEIPGDLGQALVLLDDQDAHGGHHSIAPQKTGSGVRRTPKRCSTADCRRRAKSPRCFAGALWWAPTARGWGGA